MKRLLGSLLVLLIVTAVVLIGCAAPSPSSAPAPASSAPPASKPATSAIPSSSTAPAPTAKPIELRYAHQNPPTGRTTVEHLNVWAKKVEEATKGKVKITMYPAESLAKANESLEAVKSGLADITWIIGGYFPGRFPLSEVATLPFLSLSEGMLNGKKVSGGLINSHVMEELYETTPEVQKEWEDYKVLYLYSSDPYFPATIDKPVRNLKDLSGLKIRELGGPPSDMWKRLGATPLLKPMPEVYEMLEKKVADGINVSWAQIVTYKLHEVLKYCTDAPTTLSFFGILMNKNTWNSLPPDVQQAVMSVSGYAGAELGGEAQFGYAVKDDTLKAAEKAGRPLEIVSLDPGQYDEWVKLGGKPVWDAWVAEKSAKGLASQKVLDSWLKIMDKYRIK